MDLMPVRNALISVSQKLGIVTFARGLQQAGVALFSTGGTYKTLVEAGIECTEVAEYTGFPEMLGGRIKTLHPKVHGGILARRDVPEHMAALEEHGILPFDLVVVNLYPFEQTIARPDCTFEEAIEQIDIGGPSMIRSAAKNYASVAVVTDPSQYAGIHQELNDKGGLSKETRRSLSLEAFQKSANYDRAISEYLDDPVEFQGELVLRLKRRRTLRYGENPHQVAAMYMENRNSGPAIASGRKVHGKELSYNNLLDLDSALLVVREFSEPAAVIIKHNNPCGLATSDELVTAFANAYEGDTVSAFGSVVGFNQKVDEKTARLMTEPGRFIEAVVAPAFSNEAVQLLTNRPTWKNSVRLIEVGDLDESSSPASHWEYRRITGGMLVQSRDLGDDPESDWNVVTNAEPTDDQMVDLRFAWRAVKHVKSNAIVMAADRKVIGVGAGQMNRVESVQLASRKAGERAQGAVLAGDAFFPFRDGVDRAAEAGIKAIIQPGGSKRDQEVIDACNEHGIAMVFTGRRHFRH